jgi:rSAM/selenodomain-associated transferase 2
MHFSIIIPTLNEAKNIKSCLLALQALKNSSIACEIIIVDGGSTDNTLAIAGPLADKVITSTQGRARQMNKGAKKAAGKILLFLHADTFLPDNALEIINLSLSQTTGSWGRFDIQLKGEPFLLKIISTLMNWRSRLTGIATGDQVIFVNKDLFNQVKGYPEIPLMEDIRLCTQLKKITPPICLKQKVTSSGRRWEQFGVIKTLLLMWSLRLRYFFGENPELLSILYSRGLFWKP